MGFCFCEKNVLIFSKVVGTFLPSVNQASLIGGTFGVVVANAEGDFIPQMLHELAARHHVTGLVAVQCVPTASLAVKEDDLVVQFIEIVVAMGKKRYDDLIFLCIFFF